MRHAKQEPEHQKGIWAEVDPRLKKIIYRHDHCPVHHRTERAADRCNPHDDGGGIYVLHFDRPLEGPAKIVDGYGGPQHYVGKAMSFRVRLEQHRTGKGSATKTGLALAQGITFRETLLELEDTPKNEAHVTKNAEDYCAVCAEGAPTGPLRTRRAVTGALQVRDSTATVAPSDRYVQRRKGA